MVGVFVGVGEGVVGIVDVVVEDVGGVVLIGYGLRLV